MKLRILSCGLILSLATACSTSKLQDTSLVSSYTKEAAPTSEQVDISGAILIDQPNISKFLDQVLFIGIPNSALEEPLVERNFRDAVTQSQLYKDLHQSGLQGPYIVKSQGYNYFQYKAFRDELVYQGLIKKFGL